MIEKRVIGLTTDEGKDVLIKADREVIDGLMFTRDKLDVEYNLKELGIVPPEADGNNRAAQSIVKLGDVTVLTLDVWKEPRREMIMYLVNSTLTHDEIFDCEDVDVVDFKRDINIALDVANAMTLSDLTRMEEVIRS